MKTKQEQIEEMLLDVPQTIVAYDANPKGQHLYGEQRLQIAEALYNAGYRNLNERMTCDFVKTAQKHAVQDFAEKLKEVIHERDYIQGYAEIGLIEEIDELLKEITK